MGTYRLTDDDRFMPYEATGVDAEQKLEEWLEKNSHVLLDGPEVLYVGRQVRTNLGRPMDLLAIDNQGRLIIVELKKDRAPRDIIAQALEYTAFVEGLRYDELNSIAVEYFSAKDLPWASLAEAHAASYPEFIEDEQRESERAWNHDQLIVLVAQSVPPEIIDVARYLRRHNIDIRVVQANYFQGEAGDRLVITQTLVGNEPRPEDVSREASGQRYPAIAGIRYQVRRTIDSFGSGGFRLSDFYQRFGEKFPETLQQIKAIYTNPRFNDRVFLAVQFDAARKQGYIKYTEPEDRAKVDNWPYPLPLATKVAGGIDEAGVGLLVADLAKKFAVSPKQDWWSLKAFYERQGVNWETLEVALWRLKDAGCYIEAPEGHYTWVEGAQAPEPTAEEGVPTEGSEGDS